MTNVNMETVLKGIIKNMTFLETKISEALNAFEQLSGKSIFINISIFKNISYFCMMVVQWPTNFTLCVQHPSY